MEHHIQLIKAKNSVLCLRDKQTKKLHSDEILMFVALHELSHMGNDTWGHDTKFWKTFKFVSW